MKKPVVRRKSPARDDDTEFLWSWRSLALIVYLVICVTDFIVMPLYYEWTNSKFAPAKMIALAKTMPDGQQIEALEILKSNRKWEPITNEMFHIAFGSLLTAAAWRNGRFDNISFRRRSKDGEEFEYGQPANSYDSYNPYGQSYGSPYQNSAYQQNYPPQNGDPGNERLDLRGQGPAEEAP